MSKDNNDLAKQQVLFNDMDTVIEKANTRFTEKSLESGVTAQIVFQNDDYLPENEELHNALETEANREQLKQESLVVQGEKYSWLWRIIFTSFITLLIIEAVDFFTLGFEQTPIITSIYAVLFLSITLAGSNSLWRELSGLKAFKTRQKMKHQALSFLTKNTNKEKANSNKQAKDFCDNISKSLPCDLVFDQGDELTNWYEATSNEHSATELTQIYSRVVLSKVDDKAQNEIAKFSTEAVVLIALSPIALLDMFIMLSRNLRMINKIAGLYGLKLGYWSRVKLIKQVFINMAYAGASELIADFGTDMLGAEMLGKLSARFSQGLGAGMLTARLGAKTMELCRPIPFEEKPKLTEVRKKIAEQIKALLVR